MNADRARNILIGIVGVIIVVLIVIFLIRRGQNSNNPVFSPIPTPVSSFQQNLENNFGITVPNGAATANLRDVTGGSQMGLVTLDKQNGQNTYTVIANLEEPTVGYYYQAWIVRASDNNAISLGRLNIAKAGWLTNYTTSNDLSDHRLVWVTIEKINDTNPETHVLEGSF